jgi:hypothetical protein
VPPQVAPPQERVHRRMGVDVGQHALYLSRRH